MDDKGSKNDENIPPAATNVSNRDFMVNTAVHFLQNPKVQSSPLSQKRAFLIKKGLTNEEIDAAIEKASASSIPYAPIQMVPGSDNGGHIYKPSFWTRVNRYGSAVIIVGIVLYGLQKFYKLYIEPLLYGAKRRDSHLFQMEEQLLELSRSLSQLRKSVTAIETTLADQKDELQRYLSHKCLEMEQAVNPSLFHELKSDISTVKSLLLNRRQFPDVPKFSPCIPSWQLVGSGGKNEKQIEKELEIEKDDGKDCDVVTDDSQSEDKQTSLKLEREIDEETEDQTKYESRKKETNPTETCDELCNGSGGCIVQDQLPAPEQAREC